MDAYLVTTSVPTASELTGRAIVFQFEDLEVNLTYAGEEGGVFYLLIGDSFGVVFLGMLADVDDVKKGLYIAGALAGIPSLLTIPGYTGFSVKKLNEKRLPESVDGVIIRSSTADSTKKFKLTVDDSGTITATEVT